MDVRNKSSGGEVCCYVRDVMSESYRNGIFALGLILGVGIATFSFLWIFGLNYCPGAPCSYHQGADDLTDDGSQRLWQVPDVIRGTFSYETEPEYNEGNLSRHEYYDLRAQERMAHATDWIAWLSLFAGVISAFGLVALVYTLNLQRTANKISRRAFLFSHRPRVIIRFIQGPAQNDEGQEAIWITIVNVGATLARIEAIGADFALLDQNGNVVPPGFNGAAQKVTPFSLQSGERHTIEACAKWTWDGSGGYVWQSSLAVGEIRYRDEAGVVRFTGFYRTKPNELNGVWVASDDEGLDYVD